MADAVRRILYHALVLTIILTVWAMGHAKALAEQAYGKKYWPPLNPAMFKFDPPPAEDVQVSVSPDDL